MTKLSPQRLRAGQRLFTPATAFSENAAFAEACEAAGIAFVGPTPEQLRLFGLKHTARALAKTHGVPMLEGTGLLADVHDALQAAEQVGYPVMLKSTAGGGGIGMRVCYSAAELSDAYDAVVRLGKTTSAMRASLSRSTSSGRVTLRCNSLATATER